VSTAIDAAPGLFHKTLGQSPENVLLLARKPPKWLRSVTELSAPTFPRHNPHPQGRGHPDLAPLAPRRQHQKQTRPPTWAASIIHQRLRWRVPQEARDAGLQGLQRHHRCECALERHFE